MNIISKVLSNKQKSCSLIPFITAGYPTIDTTINVLRALDENGADIIELGIPYSDALADGPVIQYSSLIALQNGVYIDQVLSILHRVQNKLNAPIVIFTYYNPILKRGIKKFIREISIMGAKGLIIPDLPLEEADLLINICKLNLIELILFIAPTSSMKRIKVIVDKSPGCIYLVSTTGVTGIRNKIDYNIAKLSNYIKQVSNKLIILGFGISTPEHVSTIAKWNIDGIVIGSAFIKKLNDTPLNEAIESVGTFCKSLKNATMDD
uniref:Tryptophan synthase alpha chain n=1 Tax=Pterothamnion crispum TaxID=1550583 RepID=A0A4D6WYH6_9FLOR|nr:Tryptophan synthase alpha subunit [Pterothamnion crispum]